MKLILISPWTVCGFLRTVLVGEPASTKSTESPREWEHVQGKGWLFQSSSESFQPRVSGTCLCTNCPQLSFTSWLATRSWRIFPYGLREKVITGNEGKIEVPQRMSFRGLRFLFHWLHTERMRILEKKGTLRDHYQLQHGELHLHSLIHRAKYHFIYVFILFWFYDYYDFNIILGLNRKIFIWRNFNWQSRKYLVKPNDDSIILIRISSIWKFWEEWNDMIQLRSQIDDIGNNIIRLIDKYWILKLLFSKIYPIVFQLKLAGEFQRTLKEKCILTLRSNFTGVSFAICIQFHAFCSTHLINAHTRSNELRNLSPLLGYFVA